MGVTLADIEQAAAAIEGAIEHTPFLHSRTLSQISGAKLYLKFENLQFTASFKERGALNKLLSLSEDERRRGVIAVSAGNHAQGVAYHARHLGIPATIVMPKRTPFVKVRQTEEFGATVILQGDMLSDAADFARGLREEKGLTFVHPYDDPLVVAGQGTIGLEILKAVPDLDDLVIPIGGGGLISGIAIAAKAINPKINIIGVEAKLYPAMKARLEGKEPVVGGATIAEGIAVKDVGQIGMEVCRELVSDILLATEAQLERAIYLLLVIEKTVVEGAGAAGLAGILANPDMFRGRKVGTVLCGGNIDPRLLTSVILRELMRDGRIARITVEIPDSPGELARIATIIGECGGSILEVMHQRLALDVSAKHTMLEMTIEARDESQVEMILEKIRALGLSVKPRG